MRNSVLLLILAVGLGAQSLDQKALGGLCGYEPEWSILFRQQLAAEERGDFNAAATLAKLVVRGDCKIEDRWFKLAELLVLANRVPEAIAVLDAAYARDMNGVSLRIRDPQSTLYRLPRTDEFRQSKLAAQLAVDRAAFEKRQRLALIRVAKVSRPPDRYIAAPSCPGEGCRFGAVTATRAVKLTSRPGGSVVVAEIPKGKQVTTLTGESHLLPRPVLMREDKHADFRATEGSIVWLLDYIGEEWGRVWVNGKIEQGMWAVLPQCTFALQACWGEFIGDAKYPSEWWVKIKTADGKVGWARGDDNAFFSLF